MKRSTHYGRASKMLVKFDRIFPLCGADESWPSTMVVVESDEQSERRNCFMKNEVVIFKDTLSYQKTHRGIVNYSLCFIHLFSMA